MSIILSMSGQLPSDTGRELAPATVITALSKKEEKLATTPTPVP
jgi:hypothetical protein